MNISPLGALELQTFKIEIIAVNIVLFSLPLISIVSPAKY